MWLPENMRLSLAGYMKCNWLLTPTSKTLERRKSLPPQAAYHHKQNLQAIVISNSISFECESCKLPQWAQILIVARPLILVQIVSENFSKNILKKQYVLRKDLSWNFSKWRDLPKNCPRLRIFIFHNSVQKYCFSPNNPIFWTYKKNYKNLLSRTILHLFICWSRSY